MAVSLGSNTSSITLTNDNQTMLDQQSDDSLQSMPEAFNAFLGLCTVAGIVSNAASLGYIKKRGLRLNQHVKRILIHEAAFSIVLYLGSASGYISVTFFDSHDLYSCSLKMVAGFLAFIGTLFFPMLIALLRYHLASATADLRVIPEHLIYAFNYVATLGFTGMVLVAFYLPFFENYAFGPSVHICMNHFGVQENKLAPFVCVMVGLASLILGLCYDLAMWCFLKKRSRTTLPMELKIVPWKKPDDGSDRSDPANPDPDPTSQPIFLPIVAGRSSRRIEPEPEVNVDADIDIDRIEAETTVTSSFERRAQRYRRSTIPLVSYNQAAKEESNGIHRFISVPILATAVGMINIVILLGVLFVLQFLGSDNVGRLPVELFVFVHPVIHIPLMLTLIIKSNDNQAKKSLPKEISPPQGLQFYD